MDDSKIFVFDLECTCWLGHPPEGMRQEIIEIGCCLLDVNTGEIGEKRSIIVRPSASTISSFCTELTSITQNTVDMQGIDLAEACAILVNEYGSRNVPSSAWGKFDTKKLRSDCKFRNVEYPLSGKHSNAQKKFMTHSSSRSEMSVINALRHIGKEFEGKQHRAVDDAYNTAVLVSHMLNAVSLNGNGHH